MAVVAAGLTLAACEGFKEALTAHVDVAARAEDQELSVERLAELIGNTDFPISPEFARRCRVVGRLPVARSRGSRRRFERTPPAGKSWAEIA